MAKIENKNITFKDELAKLSQYLEKFRGDSIKVICLEGRICSGKTTLANLIEDVCVIHCDDHFGKDEPLDYPYLEELLKNLKKGQLEEKCYNCFLDGFIYKLKEVKNIVIVEGSFSYDSRLRKYYDGLIFISISKSEQMKRLKLRESGTKYHTFLNKWIPREDKYYQESCLEKICDLIINYD